MSELNEPPPPEGGAGAGVDGVTVGVVVMVGGNAGAEPVL